MTHRIRHHHTNTCGCEGKDGHPKRAYSTEAEARQCADHVRSKRGVSLRVYECPWGRYYHLTSDDTGCGW